MVKEEPKEEVTEAFKHKDSTVKVNNDIPFYPSKSVTFEDEQIKLAAEAVIKSIVDKPKSATTETLMTATDLDNQSLKDYYTDEIRNIVIMQK